MPVVADPLPTKALDRAVAQVREAAAVITRVLGGCGLLAAGGGPPEIDLELIPSVLAWANGATFEKSWLLSPTTFEGTLVRGLRSLDEMLRQLGEAAAALGDSALTQRFGECAACVHRGIAFSSSLYLVQGD